MKTSREVAAASADSAALGSWESAAHQLPVGAIHSALLLSGKLLFVGRSPGLDDRSSACLWDPTTGATRIWDFPADFSLGAQCCLPDGRLLLTGGRKEQGVFRLSQTYLFDPYMEDWLRVNDMPGRGACPTMLELGDGRVMAVGGAGRNGGETYEKAGGWTRAPSEEMDWPLYPQLVLVADGSIFFSGQHFGGRSLLNPGLLRPGGRFEELSETATPPGFRFAFREPGGTVLLPPAQMQTVMVVSGGSPPSPEVHLVDLGGEEPALRSAARLHAGRTAFNTLILPDRTVLVCGGRGRGESGEVQPAQAELYDPATNKWSVAAPSATPPHEPSSAVLLPDGRVVLAGSAGDESSPGARLEVYHPPYLHAASRPQLEFAPEHIAFGEPFAVATADSDIRWLSLVKPIASSAGFDPGQRLVDLPFESRGPGLLQAFAPNNANIAPPGWYLMFLVNHAGVPSLGRWVRLSHASSSSTRPPVDTGHFQQRPSGAGPGVSAVPGSDGSAELRTDEVFWAETLPDGPGSGDFELEADTGAAVGKTPGPNARAAALPDFPSDPGTVAGAPSAAYETDLAPGLTASLPAVSPKALDEEVHDDRAGVEEAVPQAGGVLHSVPEPASQRVGEGAKWARPAITIGSSALLVVAMVLDFFPLRVGAALVFLLLAPGMAFVGLFRAHDWVTDLGLAIGVSIALETILTLVMLYLGVWSAERALLILLGASLVPAAVQLIRAGSARTEHRLRPGA